MLSEEMVTGRALIELSAVEGGGGKLMSLCEEMGWFSPSSLASCAAAPSQGLGKTVECIALVLERMDRREDRGSRMTAPQQPPGACPRRMPCCLARPPE